jgi:hypothetical protein
MKYQKFSFTIFLFVTLIISLSACNNKQMKFDKYKWNQQTAPVFPSPYRPKMLTDLISSYELVGFKFSELEELLGSPDYKDSTSLTYKIIVDYGHDIDPIYTKNLNFIFSKDSIIKSFKVEEWKK